MKIDAKVFGELISDIMPAIQGRLYLPVLECVHVFVRGDEILAEATNLEIGIRSSSDDVTIDGELDFVVNAKRLHRVLKEIDGELDVSCDGILHIQDGTSAFNLATYPTDDFPPLSEMDEDVSAAFPGTKLQTALKAVNFAISRDENRYVLNGALLQFDGNKCHVVATDGRRMAHYEIDGDKIDAEFNALDGQKLILPENTCRTVSQIQNANLVLFCGFNEACFKTDGLTIFSKQIEGQFPNWSQVVPKDGDLRFSFAVADVLTAVRRVSILTEDKAPSVSLTFKGDSCLVEAYGNEIGSASDVFECEHNGDGVQFALNPSYLSECIKYCGEEHMSAMTATDGTGPVLFRAGNYEAVLMPMRMNNVHARPVGETNGRVAKRIDERDVVDLVEEDE